MEKVSRKELLEQTVLPVIVSPMFLVSSPRMVVEACKSGVIGTFPLLNARTEEDLEQWLKTIINDLKEIEQDDPKRKCAPWGVNLIVHKTNKRFEGDLEIIKKYKPPIVITSLGNPAPVVNVVQEYGGLVFSDVISIEHAKKAAKSGVDGLILVSNGAGGHGGTINPLAFVAEIKEFWDGITILAGCVSRGRDILAAKVLGADFVYMGTRFIATKETLASEEYQEMLVQSTVTDIIYTDAITGVKGNYLVPSIRNAGLDPDNLEGQKVYNVKKRTTEAKAWKNIWGAGQGVGSIKSIEPISHVVEELKKEYEQALYSLTAKS
ncbi:nitronate monooxygenase family protein [Sporosarcina sp. P33]|uniref:NAD(P)H-dependent flavin oxidoreductase n=1 Tax=Sporosarcina sp. P33 TaxID=1930764 RepID=UPI0009C23E67|nr:nitronate monooxygenase [Sporosarcina sp. P33]ARD47056.1 2-nitropropane dioxygenase [Sporosarcina sp. P33]